MTNTIQDYSVNAQMADACYVELRIDNNSDSNKKLNKDVLITRNFTSDQAKSFLDQYTPVFHYPNDLTGLSFTIFQERESGVLTLALRGTEGVISLDAAWADMQVIFSGLAESQSLSLFNALQILRMPEGTSEFVQAKNFDYIIFENGIYYGYDNLAGIPNPLSRTRLIDASPECGIGKLIVDKSLLHSDLLLSNAGLLYDKSINITGHSLGGHLATVAYQLLGENAVNHVYTYNAPGIDSFDDNVLALGGSACTDSKVTNIKGSGWDVIAGYKDPHGEVVKVFEETNSHFIEYLSDALRVMDVMSKIDSNVSIQTLNSLLERASYKNNFDLEKTVEFLYDIFIPNGNTTGFDEQLFELTQAPLTAGCITTSVGINGEAGSIGKLYALLTGCPFIISGVDYSQTALGKAGLLNYDLYSREHLQARSEYLGYLLEANTRDSTAISGPYKTITDFVSDIELHHITTELGDIVTGGLNIEDLTFLSEGRSDYLNEHQGNRNHKNNIYGSSTNDYIQTSDKGSLVYGEYGDDTIRGGIGIDFLHGGQGNDSLFGGDGSDFLYGDEGNDTLYGGNHTDFLYGGDGNNTLDGGKSNDQLFGGKNNDTYLFSEGCDMITDQGGQDIIRASTHCKYVVHRGKQIVFDATGKNDMRVQSGFIEEIQLGTTNS